MTLTLNLPPETESALASEARRQNTTLERLALEGLRQLYPAQNTPVSIEMTQTDPTLALFAQWAIEDATDDPVEIARRQKEGDELMAALQANRFSLEGRTDFKTLFGDDEQGSSEDQAE